MEINAEWINQLVATYGYIGIAVIVGLESMGLPLPGETTLVLASMYAAHNPDFSILGIVLASSIGAIVGDNVGYSIGYRFGYPLLLKHGARIGVTDPRIKLGQYLFMRWGFLVVFFGRFVALLRILAAFLAGVNRMRWPVFLIANAAGGILWSCVFGFGGYWLGEAMKRFSGVLGPAIFVFAVAAFLAGGYFVRRYEKRLEIEAERAMPGPLRTS
jgi:membrane protein DedA with SNARE-associated domain